MRFYLTLMEIIFEGNLLQLNSSITLLRAVKYDNSHSASDQINPMDYQIAPRFVEHKVTAL